MSEWGVALLVIFIICIVAVGIGFLLRLYGVYNLTSCFTYGEEKAVLTKNEHYNGYMKIIYVLDMMAVGDKSLKSAYKRTVAKYDSLLLNGALQSLMLCGALDSLVMHILVVLTYRSLFTPKVNSENDFVLDTSGKFVQYDTLQSDPKYINMAGHSPPREEPSPTGSPTSLPSTSMASEYELGHGIKRAESCESVASDCSVFDMQPDISKIGQLEFAVEYDREVCELVLSIIQAKDLQPNQFTGSLDTYIRVMMPGDGTKFSTKVQRNTCNPVYKERFLFNVDSTDLEQKILQFQVFSVDKYARHKVIGESEIKIGDIDLRVPIKMWLNLRDLDERHAEYGDIMFSLSYLPTAERLTIVVVKARNLKWVENKESGDPFVKIYLLQNGKKVNKKRTTVKRGERNPIFNEAMIFSVPASALTTVQLRITVAELMGNNRTPSLGHVIVGNNTSGTELSHWNQMMTSLRKPVAMWHNLRK